MYEKKTHEKRRGVRSQTGQGPLGMGKEGETKPVAAPFEKSKRET